MWSKVEESKLRSVAAALGGLPPPPTWTRVTGSASVCTATKGARFFSGEVSDSVQRQTGLVVERSSRITGYTTGIGFFGHALGESNDDMKALIAGTAEYFGPGIIVPARNTDLLRWCMNNNLRIMQNPTLMSIGLYNEPQGAWLPSILMQHSWRLETAYFQILT